MPRIEKIVADMLQPSHAYPAAHSLTLRGEQLVQQTQRDVLRGSDYDWAKIRLPEVGLDVYFSLVQLGPSDRTVGAGAFTEQAGEIGRQKFDRRPT